jgi:hypothetical protein
MTTSVSYITPNTVSVARSSRAAALLSLMNFYEEDANDEAAESETELMVLLSGMVAVDMSLTVGE